MGNKIRRYDCVDCGTLTIRQRRSYDPKICISCGIMRLTVNSLLMRAKAGKGYDRWLNSNGPLGRPRKR